MCDQERAAFPIPKLKDNVTGQEAISLLEAEVRKHEYQIAALKTEMNSFAPISRLPPELLCKIIKMVRPTYASLKWIQLSHVCYAWRNLMIQSPSFWTLLPIASPRWTKEMILRSKEANLTVLIDLERISSSTRERFISTAISALEQLPRIQELKIIGDFPIADDLQRLLDSLPLGSAPALETLSLCCDNRLLIERSEVARLKEITLPTQSLRGMERLRSLNATSCRINWENHLANLPMLTRLKINNVTASSVPTTTAFWNALRNMGALQILHLSGTLPIVDDASRSNSKVHLPNLLCIHLRGEPDQIARFLNGVVLPTEVLLDLLCEAADSISCVDALRALSATIQLEVGTLTISQPVKNGYQIRANFTHQTAQKTKQFAWKHSEYGSFESNLSLRVTIQHPADIELPPLDDLWTTLFHELPFFKVSKATLDLEAPIPAVVLAATLGALPKLESLDVDTRLSTIIVHALQQDPPAFPSLSDLTLYENDFRSIYSWNGSTCTHEELLECMTKRRKCELPIRQLTLSGNRFWFRRTKNKTAALREVVDKVEYGLNSLSIIYDVDYSRYEESEPEA